MFSAGSIRFPEGFPLEVLADICRRLVPLENTKTALGITSQSHSPFPAVASIP